MKYLYFVEIDGVKYYKGDTFWSKTSDITQAKCYNEHRVRLLVSYGQGFGYWKETEPDDYKSNYSKHDGALLGYSEYEDSIDDDSVAIKTAYLFIFNLNFEAECSYTDYKKVNRSSKIDKILK